VGILVTFVPPKVTARRGMSDKPAPLHSGNAKRTTATPKRNGSARAKKPATEMAHPHQNLIAGTGSVPDAAGCPGQPDFPQYPINPVDK